ncbi:uncharacterized protein LOC110710302 [Chenopodium quinoa]|uniref:Ureidoglycolate hydrolase n=1 Tax=Chenopodium quinoa TaxID=63459 RepID=A0A803LZ86_CHEQI|nr:uncharacterized protein LOC110710302 [Chenopodium quinoa]
MEGGNKIKLVKLKAVEATPENFKDYGQVIQSSSDGEEFGPHDAQLDLSRGIPRFYIMQLKDRGLKFSTITHHANVTQCLGSIGGHVWYLGVAKPSIVDLYIPPSVEEVNDSSANVVEPSKKIAKSPCGHLYVPPSVEEVQVFKVTGPTFLKLNVGTWHAGPLFVQGAMDFYNLELTNTNVVDHTTHNFRQENGVQFVIDE